MTVNNRQTSGFTFTGWHMLGVMLLFFGTVITVNMVMAWNAVNSWSGLVVPNTYVASQQFNAKAEAAKARAATGIKGKLIVDEKTVRYEVFHPDTGPVDTDKGYGAFSPACRGKPEFRHGTDPGFHRRLHLPA